MSDFHIIDIVYSENEPITNYNAIVEEWVGDMSGKEGRPSYQRERKIEKVPPLLLRGRKNLKKREYYEPAVISLGPYHHNKNEILRQSEKYKTITLQVYVSTTGETIEFFYNEVLKVIDTARNCYVDVSKEMYDDKQFAEMLLRDSCFILFYIESISLRDNTMMLHNEHLGALGFANITRDIFLLENQIPFVVLQVLMNLKYPGNDKGETILRKFFSYLNYGEIKEIKKKKVFPDENEKQPLHLLELYRAHFISISSGHFSEMESNFNYVKVNRSLSSLRVLRAKGIRLKRTSIESSEDIKFSSNVFFGKLQLPLRALSPNSKAIFLNMIAYEMSPHNPNDLRVATYIRFMKSLIVHHDDVKELRTKGVLIHSLGTDDEVVKMYQEIDTPAVNSFMLRKLKRGIEKHCKSKCMKWTAELFSLYFSNPWRAIAFLVAAAILVAGVLQTVFTIWPKLQQDKTG